MVKLIVSSKQIPFCLLQISVSSSSIRIRLICAEYILKPCVCVCNSVRERIRDLPWPWCVQVRGAWMIGGGQGLVVAGTRGGGGGGGEDGSG